ncbi:hypothetical protein VP1G_08943 [Cytospora mali]|uniref:HAUS augmin-like complex subunit 4 n=1 Tax=Cytospora mali TaxID=578113 RepID=A0A194VD42_CYTMA|nr:hypothetical protein VP1G_08943 [Valsa mali var. pyri (nom. inval.)]
MFPPVEDAVLQNNPQFAALYGALTSAILNPDGTTKDDKGRAVKERDAVRKELDAHRLKSAKQHLLAQSLSAAVPPEPDGSSRRSRLPSELPEPLLDLLLLLPPLLASAEQSSPDSLQLLLSSPPFTSLEDHMSNLASLVSSSLQSSAVQLARAAYPTTNASFLHRHIPFVPSHIRNLSSDVRQQSVSLAGARSVAANALVRLLQDYTQALTLLIRSLEAKHGGVARSLEFRAADVALEAQFGQVNAEMALWNVRRDLYSPEVREALSNYNNHLRDGQRRLSEAARTARAELVGYGIAIDGEAGDVKKERALREAARAYRDMSQQVEEAQRDLGRLR